MKATTIHILERAQNEQFIDDVTTELNCMYPHCGAVRVNERERERERERETERDLCMSFDHIILFDSCIV